MKVVYVIDKLHTTEVIRYTLGGYAIDTEANTRWLCEAEVSMHNH